MAVSLDDVHAPSMRQRMEDAGITDAKLIAQLKKELKATKTQYFQDKGIVTDEREVVDWATRQKARMDAHELRGDYPAKSIHVGDVDGGSLFGDLSDAVRDMIEALRGSH